MTAKRPQKPVAQSWWVRLRAEPPPLTGKLLGAGCIAFVIFVWWLITRGEFEERIISQPSPWEVVSSFPALWKANLMSHIAASMERLLYGFGLATLVGVSLGMLAGSWRGIQAFSAPIVLLGRSLPLAALIPITLLLFGTGDKQKVMFIFIATVPFIFSDSAAAVIAIPERYVETAQTLGATRWQIIRKVLVPLALPRIYTSVRFLFGLAFGYIMLAEAIDAETGIGGYINVLQKRGIYDSIYMLLIVLGLLAFAIDRVLAYLERGFFPYRREA